PSLNVKYSDIKQLAGQKSKEVLTADDMSDPGVTWQQTQYHLSYDEGSYSKQYEAAKTSTLQELTADVAAGMKGAVGARWAFDCNTNSFLLYVPGGTKAS